MKTVKKELLKLMHFETREKDYQIIKLYVIIKT